MVVLGNSRALWPHFVHALQQRPGRCEEDHPFDRWVHGLIRSFVDPLPWPSAVRFADEGPPRAVAIQHLAAQAGLAHLGPAGLSVHPVHGPWVSWRAAIVFGVTGPDEDPPATDRCTGCDAPCVSALQTAVATMEGRATVRELGDGWRLWLQVRDVCPIGQEARFPEDQIRYHYAKDRETLRRLTETTPEGAGD